MKYIASVSFGKDSLAMLFLLIENNYPLDEVVFYNTEKEFTALLDTRDKVLPILKNLGIKYTELKPKIPMEDKMYNYPHLSRNGELKKGYGWCGGLCRWGTSEKTNAINKYCKNAHQYVGIAIDEPKRLERLDGIKKSSPLAQLGFTEKMALDYCYAKGFYWIETKGGAGPVRLYEILYRVSCWCCRNKNLYELMQYKRFLPNYFNMLVELENKIGEPMKKPVYLLERRLGDEQNKI